MAARSLFWFLVGMASGCAIASIVIAVFLYAARRQGEWDGTAVKANFIEGCVFLSKNPKLSAEYGLALVYGITNATRRDYTLAEESSNLIPMELHQGGLIYAPGLKLRIPAGSGGTENDASPDEIIVPPGETVQVAVMLRREYKPEVVKGKTARELTLGVLEHVNSLVVLDSMHRYRIEFAVSQFKGSQQLPICQ